MDVTSQWNIQMKEKTARKLEKSFIEAQTCLFGVYTRSLVQSVTVAYSHQGGLMVNPSCEPWEAPAWLHFIKHTSPTNQVDL